MAYGCTEQEEAAAQRLVELRSNAPLGEVVQCTFRDAKAKFGKNEWLPVQNTSFTIHRSEDDPARRPTYMSVLMEGQLYCSYPLSHQRSY